MFVWCFIAKLGVYERWEVSTSNPFCWNFKGKDSLLMSFAARNCVSLEELSLQKPQAAASFRQNRTITSGGTELIANIYRIPEVCKWAWGFYDDYEVLCDGRNFLKLFFVFQVSVFNLQSILQTKLFESYLNIFRERNSTIIFHQIEIKPCGANLPKYRCSTGKENCEIQFLVINIYFDLLLFKSLPHQHFWEF